jgi:hypothetical protein
MKMRMKYALKYQINEYKKPVITFYIVIYSIYILMTLSNLTRKNPDDYSNVGGMEMASMIFLFVAGLNCFKQNFRMLMQNGISRRSVFTSNVLGILPVAGLMALVDSINRIIFGQLAGYQSFFQMLYPGWHGGQMSFLQITLEGFVWMFFMYCMAAMAGYFITTLYYRMNKPVKLAVSIGVPVMLFVVLPYIDNVLSGLHIFKGIYQFTSWAFGFNTDNPYMAVATCTVIFVVFGVLSWLLVRRAPIKD